MICYVCRYIYIYIYIVYHICCMCVYIVCIVYMFDIHMYITVDKHDNMCNNSKLYIIQQRCTNCTITIIRITNMLTSMFDMRALGRLYKFYAARYE